MDRLGDGEHVLPIFCAILTRASGRDDNRQGPGETRVWNIGVEPADVDLAADIVGSWSEAFEERRLKNR